MKSNKIVFIANSLSIQRVIKRINSFVDAGYNVEVYGFMRSDVGHNGNVDIRFKYSVIGEFPNSMPYIKRLFLMHKCIKDIIPSVSDGNTLLYLFGLETALVTTRLTKTPYVYEEADLVHTYIGNRFVRSFLEKKDVNIIKKSQLTVLTSEGFVDYHFGINPPSNITVVSNRLNPSVLNLKKETKPNLDVKHLKFGFVGSFRFDSIVNFCRVFVKEYPQHEMHVYGVIDDTNRAFFSQFDNFYYHGPFKNPDDLPNIYANIDLSLSTYDATTVNARYAEPNKMYEAIYFDTPIIVSKDTYLEKKVRNLGIGYAIDALADEEILSFVNGLSIESIDKCVYNLKKINKSEAVNSTDKLFEHINKIVLN